MNLDKEQELRDLYYDPVNGYRSREKLYQKAREKGLKISRHEVKEWLETQDINPSLEDTSPKRPT